MKRGNIFGAGLIIFIVILLLFQSGFVFKRDVELTFSVLGKTLHFTGGQQWEIFDRASRLIQLSDSTPQANLFFSLTGSYPTVDMNNVGWVRVHEWFHLAEDIGGDWNTQAIVFTRDLSAQVSVDGASYASVDFIPWNQPNSWINYIQGWSHQSDVVFATGDLPGTERSAIIYLIFDASKKPSDCVQHPSACLNLSSKIAEGHDFKIELKITEIWDDYTVEPYFPLKTCPIKVGHMVNTCINPLDHRTVALTWGSNLYEYGYHTTVSGTSGVQTSFVQTKWSTAIETATIHVTRTVEHSTTKLMWSRNT